MVSFCLDSNEVVSNYKTLAYGVPELASRISITLLEAGPRLLAAFPEDISAATRTRLETLGVKVMTGAQ
ncbi:TPA: NAD-binding protein, partial [Pseudomonas aeruginosa]|nr:NAD-binding protein [Pseudomonas aeruginosa]